MTQTETADPVTILVVDDEPDVEMLVTQQFRRDIRKGLMRFVFARDGQQALDTLSEAPDVALVLSDINMPRMDGLTLLGHLRENHADLRTIVVSAYGDLGNIRTAMNRGAFDFVTKPIDFDDLRATIDKTVETLRAYAELRRQRAEAEEAKTRLSRYFSPSVARTLVAGHGDIDLTGERREATFLFTDLAGFTALVETAEPSLIVELLNPYLDGLARRVFDHDGTVMKVIGDAMQVVFGAPVAQEDHAARAVECARAIDAFAEAYRADWRGKGIKLGETRIGVNAGTAVIGNFGGETFFDYTAYGDAVNTAARLEAANKTLGTRICVADNVAARIDGFCGRPAGRLMLQGRSDPLLTFEPVAETGPETAAYGAAYALMEAGDSAARPAFAALMAQAPDDPLTMFHLQRLLAGATDDIIRSVAK